MFHAAPLPHQSGLRPASFPGGEALVPGFRALGIFGNGSVLSRSGTAHRPFPTYFTGRIQMNNVGCPKIVNCQLPIVNWQRTAARPLVAVRFMFVFSKILRIKVQTTADKCVILRYLGEL